MRPVVLTGPAFYPDGFREVTLHLDRGRISRVEDGLARDADHHGILLPGPVNGHVHLGDAFLRGRVPDLPLADLVAPPHGWKHRELAAARDEDVLGGIRLAATEAAAHGSLRATDFREGGTRGLALARRALAGTELIATLLARPASLAECAPLARQADGLQVSSLADVPRPLAEAAADAGRMFATHHSERVRDDIDAVLALDPDFLVHLVHATPADLRKIADARVQVVTCPTSNARFGPPPPFPAMVEAGCDLALGSDNAMLNALDPVREARALRAWFPDVAPLAILRALAGGTRACLRSDARWSGLAPGEPADLLIVDTVTGDPPGHPPLALFRPDARVRHARELM